MFTGVSEERVASIFKEKKDKMDVRSKSLFD
jgi:hypothetical protein